MQHRIRLICPNVLPGVYFFFSSVCFSFLCCLVFLLFSQENFLIFFFEIHKLLGNGRSHIHWIFRYRCWFLDLFWEEKLFSIWSVMDLIDIIIMILHSTFPKFFLHWYFCPLKWRPVSFSFDCINNAIKSWFFDFYHFCEFNIWRKKEKCRWISTTQK